MFSYAQANAVAGVSINSDEDVINEQQKQSVTSQDQHKRQTLIQMHR